MTTPIVALDFPDLRQALEMVKRLGDECDFYKVGSELYTAAGPAAITRLREEGCTVFLDLKYHDIPTTVRRSVAAAARLGVRLITVHASGGRAMLEAALLGARDGRGDLAVSRERTDPLHLTAGCRVLAVTVLTSHSAESLAQACGRPDAEPVGEVLRLAGLAAESGVTGVVCAGTEAPLVRRTQPQLEILVPGVRLPGYTQHDQVRVVTAGEAAQGGATYIVLGRTVTEAPDPAAAMREVRRQLSTRK